MYGPESNADQVHSCSDTGCRKFLSSCGVSATARSPVSPKRELVESVVREAYEKFRGDTSGKNADYIPYLPKWTQRCLASPLSRPITRYSHLRSELLVLHPSRFQKSLPSHLRWRSWARTGYSQKLGPEPTGATVQLALAVVDMPSHSGNPLVNAGAIATTSLSSGQNAAEKWNKILDFYSKAAGRKTGPDR